MAPDKDNGLSPNTVVAGFRVEREIGRGAMAVVYKALQLNLDRAVALKILTADQAHDKEFVVRFFNEARAAAQLTHPNIIQAYDAGIADNDVHYFAMEYVEGETLLQTIEREGFLRPAAALAIAYDIADALDCGWERQQLTHGDIKPENIILNRNGETKLADFGLAKVSGHDFDGSDIMLTPLYGAPEVINGARSASDCRADIYSFGATLYHMLAGVPPYPGDDPHEVMQRHLDEPLTPVTQRNPSISKDLSDFVGSLLAKDPAARPSTWADVKKAIKGLRRPKSRKVVMRGAIANVQTEAAQHVMRTHAGSQRKSGSGLRWALIAAVFVLGSAVAFLFLTEQGKSLTARRSTGGPQKQPPKRIVQQQPGRQTAVPGAAAAAAEEWSKLKGELEQDDDLEGLLSRLEDFGKRHGAAAPADFAARLKEVQDALEWRRARAAAGSGTTDQDGMLDDLKVIARERESVPDEDGRLASLDQHLVADDGASTGPGREEDGSALARLASTVPEADRVKAYWTYMAKFAKLKYSPARAAATEPFVRNGKEWLLRFPDESREQHKMRFFVDVVLPGLGEFLPKLVQGAEHLTGKKIPGRKYAKEGTISEITPGKIVLSKRTQHGNMTQQVPWSALDHPAYFVLMGNEVFGSDSLPLAERRPYLALLLATHSYKYWDAALEGAPEKVERRLWDAVRKDCQAAPEQSEAFALWDRAVAALEDEAYTKAYAALQELSSGRSIIRELYTEAIEKAVKECQPHVSEYVAGDLVRRAKAKLQVDPGEALVLLSTAIVRYGRTDFPEREGLYELHDKALEGLPRPRALERYLDHPLDLFGPFLYLFNSAGAFIDGILYGAMLEKREELPANIQQMLPGLKGLVLMEFGDWRRGRSVLTRDVAAPNVLPFGQRLSVTLAKALAAARFEDDSLPPPMALQLFQDEYSEVRPGDPRALFCAIAKVEYALVCNVFEAEPDAVLNWKATKVGTDGPLRGQVKRFVLGALTWLIEGGRAEDAVNVLTRLTRDGASLASFEFSKQEEPFLTALRSFLMGEGELKAPGAMAPAFLGSHYERLVLAAALHGAPDRDLPLAADTDGPPVRVTRSLLWHDVTFNRVLWDIQRALSQGRGRAALQAVSEALALNAPAMAAYFPRLCFLQAGLLAANGRTARAAEVLALVRESTVANDSEEQVSRCWQRSSSRSRGGGRPEVDGRAVFWYWWLMSTRALGAKDTEAARAAVEQMLESADSSAQRRLAAVLQKALR